jgi:HEPN domain-containing protein
MPPAPRPPDDPHEWLRRARSNLARAQADIRLAGVYLEDLCFDAQQAAEKAIKAVLIGRSIRFPYVHDLTALLGLVEQGGTAVPEAVREAGRLTRFAVVTRYPGIAEPVTQEEYERAVAIAEAVIDWAGKTVLMQP